MYFPKIMVLPNNYLCFAKYKLDLKINGFSTLLILLVFANAFLFPFVFNRYGFIILVAFVFVVINDYKKYKFNNFFILSFLIISILTTCLDIIIERDKFEKSYTRVGLLTLPTFEC